LNFKFIWGLCMVVIYLCMFFVLVFTNLFANTSLTMRILLGIIFLIYGVFRGYSVWKSGK